MDRPPSRVSLKRVEQGLVALVFAWITWTTIRVLQAGWPFTTDDAFITMRYARNLAEGHGLAWNVGELVPVEGYSNFLFVWLGAAAIKVGLDPIIVIKILCCLCIAPTCGLLYLLARRWVSPLPATLPAVLLTAHPGLTFWAVSGLETTVFQLLVVAATTSFIIGLDAPLVVEVRGTFRWPWSRARLHLASAVCCCLASLTRPEGPVLCGVLGVTALLDSAVHWFRARRKGDSVAEQGVRLALMVTLRAFLVGFLAPYGLYFLWRVVHFGRLLPNTAYCKSVYNDRGDEPWALTHDFWDQAKVFILLALVQDPRKLGARALPLFLLPLAYVGILFHADPIVGQFSRHFLAAISLLVVASSIGLTNVAKLILLPLRLFGTRGEERRGWSVLADTSVVVACLILYSHGHRWLDIPGRTIQCETDRADHKDPWLLSPPFDLAYHASCYSNRNEGRFDLGRYLERTLTPQQTYVLGDTGIAPYLSHANVIDSFCLNSPELTRPPISYDTRRFIDSIFERAPDVIVMHGYNGSQYSPLNDETNFYKTLAGDPRFRARYQRKPGSPVFHAHTFAGEAWYSYWIFEKKP